MINGTSKAVRKTIKNEMPSIFTAKCEPKGNHGMSIAKSAALPNFVQAKRLNADSINDKPKAARLAFSPPMRSIKSAATKGKNINKAVIITSSNMSKTNFDGKIKVVVRYLVLSKKYFGVSKLSPNHNILKAKIKIIEMTIAKK